MSIHSNNASNHSNALQSQNPANQATGVWNATSQKMNQIIEENNINKNTLVGKKQTLKLLLNDALGVFSEQDRQISELRCEIFSIEQNINNTVTLREKDITRKTTLREIANKIADIAPESTDKKTEEKLMNLYYNMEKEIRELEHKVSAYNKTLNKLYKGEF